MSAVQVTSPGESFEVVDRPVPETPSNGVRIEVEACGVCHSDSIVKEGTIPGLDINYPRIPGHEVIGRVDAVGSAVTAWEPGQRVGVGWHGGHCFSCEQCGRGDFTNCERKRMTGVTSDGGYAEFMVARPEAVISVPESLEARHAAGLVCAGMTAFNALRHSSATQGDVVAVLGIGGVGHLGVQFASVAGYETVALSRGSEKRSLAKELGADQYVDTDGSDPGETLQSLGGADVILATAPSSGAIESVVPGLAVNGELVVVGLPEEPVSLNLGPFVSNRQSLQGWDCGHAGDATETLAFSARNDIEPMVETYPLDRVEDAYSDMMRNETQFKPVLEP
ncbi:alcohol dehydrogenase [Haloarcula salinisoli]|uniref:Alcohol dehydrogenase n=1 Tax=Haloarcula salinisoli TaxID=2487746 RepID=A0A8J8CD71_9EURY|nr:alcohol dehydrogenase [Halomicroarcula salinisoli]MBX0288607.1 alcohol dehydrogenase [Halomicroarcula salinisoli]MBX0306013.1 alcohol dehydrogenase [Halomicroarcula salinisoli]